MHGWREFLGEVGIIMLGVLLALSAEQLVEALHWKHRVDLGREALNGDIAALRFVIEERALIAPCLAKRTAEIKETIDVASTVGQLPAIGEMR